MTKFNELKIENYLEDEEDVKGFLDETNRLNDGSPEDFEATLNALKIAARAMSRIELAEKTGLTREAVRLFIQPNSNPRTSTISKIASSLGYRIRLEPIKKRPSRSPKKRTHYQQKAS